MSASSTPLQPADLTRFDAGHRTPDADAANPTSTYATCSPPSTDTAAATRPAPDVDASTPTTSSNGSEADLPTSRTWLVAKPPPARARVAGASASHGPRWHWQRPNAADQTSSGSAPATTPSSTPTASASPSTPPPSGPAPCHPSSTTNSTCTTPSTSCSNTTHNPLPYWSWRRSQPADQSSSKLSRATGCGPVKANTSVGLRGRP